MHTTVHLNLCGSVGYPLRNLMHLWLRLVDYHPVADFHIVDFYFSFEYRQQSPYTLSPLAYLPIHSMLVPHFGLVYCLVVSTKQPQFYLESHHHCPFLGALSRRVQVLYPGQLGQHVDIDSSKIGTPHDDLARMLYKWENAIK